VFFASVTRVLLPFRRQTGCLFLSSFAPTLRDSLIECRPHRFPLDRKRFGPKSQYLFLCRTLHCSIPPSSLSKQPFFFSVKEHKAVALVLKVALSFRRPDSVPPEKEKTLPLFSGYNNPFFPLPIFCGAWASLFLVRRSQSTPLARIELLLKPQHLFSPPLIRRGFFSYDRISLGAVFSFLLQ